MTRTHGMVVLVVCDSLRADLVSADVAPTLSGLRDGAAHFAQFRGVFPSTTRTSAASIATGCLPLHHGLLGNTMVLDEAAGLACYTAGAPDFLDRLRRATGRALQRPTLHERVRERGTAVAMSNVSPGAAYVHDPEGAGFVYHRCGSFGPGRVKLERGLGIEVGVAGDDAMCARFCEHLREHQPPYAVLWLSEPDHTGHHSALGSPEHRRAIAAADANLARVLAELQRIDPTGERVLFATCSDHGMQTIRRKVDLDEQLVNAGFKASRTSSDIVIAPQGTSAILHFSPQARPRIEEVANWLRAQDFAGRVISGDALREVGLPVDGASLAIALSLACDDEPNAFGVRGRSDFALSPFGGEGYQVGHGQHGGLGPYEQRPFLVLRGPGFRNGRRNDEASLVDLAPTFLRHLGLPRDGMDGRELQDG